MLTIYEGGFTSVAHDELIKNISRCIERGMKVFLFVPEQQTLSAEAEACDLFPPSAALSFEVTNFTRFTNTAFRSLGGISGEYVTSAKRALVMWGVLTELSPMLTMTRGSKNIGSGIVNRALDAINELSSLGIRPDQLKESESALTGEDSRLLSKLNDLSLIYSLYKTKLSESYQDVSEDISSLAKKLGKTPEYLDNAAIFIEGFTSFTEPQYELIKALIELCPTTVSLAARRAARDNFEYTEIRETRSRLISLSRSLGCETEIKNPDTKNVNYNPILSEVCELLWRNEGEIDNDSLQKLKDDPETLRIFEASTPFDECDFIASDIKRRVLAGASYSDFALIARSLDYYQGVLDTSLTKAGVPHFMSSPKSVASFEAIKLISAAYAVLTRRFATADVLTYVKCGLCDATRDECDLFELYVTKWNISGRRFTDGENWNMNPRGYDSFKEGDSELLVKINDIRERIISPLEELSLRANDAMTVREHAEALLDFLIKIDLEGKLDRRSRELASLGEGEAAKQNARLWRIICDSLDLLVDVLGDVTADAESFINQLNVVFSDTNLASIPSYHDQVSVGRADMVRFNDKKHVYLIGVNLGEFPKTVSDTSYFTERDKAALARCGIGFKPDLEIKNARELYSFSRSFSFARESVTLLYSVKTTSLGAAQPSEVIERIGEITKKTVKPVDISKIPLIDKIYSPAIALENLGAATKEEKLAIHGALKGSEYAQTLKVSDGKLENDEVNIDEEALGIIIGEDVYLSQTKIDKYLMCPFRYFASAHLEIAEDEKAEINQLIVGNFIHSVLEGVFNTMIERGESVSSLSKKEREDITLRFAKEYVKKELGSVSSAKNSVIIDRINRVAKPIVDGLCDEFANCRFTPAQCELHIDGYDPKTPDSIIYNTSNGKHRIVIGGYIDRLDTLKVGDDVYVRVVDYKTGIKKFSLDEVKNGENLQMLLYLKAVVETESPEFLERMKVGKGGRLIPAGIVYVRTSVADVTIDRPSDELALEEVKAGFERLGASLDSSVSLSAMNRDFIPSQKTKDKEDAPLTYSLNDWDRLNREMETAVRSIADEITGGHVVAKAKQKNGSSFHPCEKCQYKYICRNAVK